jgi:ribokinase
MPYLAGERAPVWRTDVRGLRRQGDCMTLPRTGGRLFVVGSANEDLVVTVASLPQPGQTVLAHDFAVLPGGKGANQAVAAARAGGDVVFVGSVGRDAAGGRTIAALRAEGIDVADVVDSAAPTGVALVTVADGGENQIVVVAGANDRLTGAHVTAALARMQSTDVCLISFEIGDEAVAAAALYSQQIGAAVMVNPSPARTLVPQILHAGPILVPNESEAAQISGRTGIAAATWLCDVTGAPVVMTVGAQGAIVVDHGDAYSIAPPAVDVVDTTGAGDTFAGVLAAMIAQGLDLRAAVEQAVISAAISVTSRGARRYRTEAHFDGSDRA